MKFEFRTGRSFQTEYDYDKAFAIIERIRSRCSNYKIYESFGGHPADAFNAMSLPDNDNEEYINDNFLLFFDAAKNLININFTLSGKYGWDNVADVVDIQSGVGINDWHWTLNTYVLKPEYSQLLIDELSELEAEIRQHYEDFLASKKKKEKELERIKQSHSNLLEGYIKRRKRCP